jgi:hypothetical protein
MRRAGQCLRGWTCTLKGPVSLFCFLPRKIAKAIVLALGFVVVTVAKGCAAPIVSLELVHVKRGAREAPRTTTTQSLHWVRHIELGVNIKIVVANTGAIEFPRCPGSKYMSIFKVVEGLRISRIWLERSWLSRSSPPNGSSRGPGPCQAERLRR